MPIPSSFTRSTAPASMRSAVDYEMIFVLDGPREEFAAGLAATRGRGRPHHRRQPDARIRRGDRADGRIRARVGQDHRHAARLPPDRGDEIAKLVAALDHCDLAVARRWPRAGGPFERLRRGAFHGLLACVTGLRFRDLGCGARACNRRVLEEIQLYGDQHRFLPVLADRKGFRVREVDVRQSPEDRFTRASTSRGSTRADSWTYSRFSSSCDSRRSRCGFSA